MRPVLKYQTPVSPSSCPLTSRAIRTAWVTRCASLRAVSLASSERQCSLRVERWEPKGVENSQHHLAMWRPCLGIDGFASDCTVSWQSCVL